MYTCVHIVHAFICDVHVHVHVHVILICVNNCAEIDLDVDDLLPFQVDKLNVIALDYGVQPGAYSKSVHYLY